MMQTPYPSASLSPARRSLLRPLRRGAAGFVLLAAVAFTGAACSSEEPLGLDGAGSGASGSRVPAYVSLRLTAPSDASPLKRDTPLGGEQGDGSETGQDNENAVRTVTAFFYPNGVTINSADGYQQAVAVLHFDDNIAEVPTTDGTKVYQTPTEGVEGLDPGHYEVLVVVNGGDDMSGQAGTLPTIGELRDQVRSDALWTATSADNLSTYSNFVMASAAQGAGIDITESSSNSETPATTEISVERLAARVDYHPGDAGNFTLTKGTDGANYSGTVTIEGLALVNNLSLGEYYFKRVTQGTTFNGAPSYLGDETTSPSGNVAPGTNYVRDPWTHLKNELNATTGTPFRLGGYDYSAEELFADGRYFPADCQNNAAFWSAASVRGIDVDGGYRIAAYTHENTLPADAPLENYATAAVFKAKFTPTGLDGYQDGYTFFDYAGVLYVDLEDLMRTYHGAAYEACQSAIDGAADWAAVRAAALSLTANDPTGYREWLILQIPADGSGTPVAGNLTWEHYMDAEVGYRKTADSGAETDRNNKVTQDELIEYGVRTFYRSECYYTWFLKHAEDGDNAVQGVMEYGVVRNNIYKLKVTGVRDLGGMVPEEDNRLRVSVYVNDWQLLPSETLHM